MSQQTKNYLFISNNCQHSKKLMTQLQQSHNALLLSSFQIINIDDSRIQLPQFVQCVPTLYIPSKKHVLTDTDLFQWFQNEMRNTNQNSGSGGYNNNNMQQNNNNNRQNYNNNNNNNGQNNNNNNGQNNNNSGTINISDITGDPNILPFQSSEMGDGLSGSTYSFIEDSKNDLMNQNYSFLQDRDINKVPEFTKHNATQSNGNNSNNNKGAGQQQRKTGGSTDTAYDSLMQSRNSEMQNQKPAIPQTPNFNDPW